MHILPEPTRNYELKQQQQQQMKIWKVSNRQIRNFTRALKYHHVFESFITTFNLLDKIITKSRKITSLNKPLG